MDSTIFHPQGGGQPADTGFIFNSDFKFSVQYVRSQDKIVCFFNFRFYLLSPHIAMLVKFKFFFFFIALSVSFLIKVIACLKIKRCTIMVSSRTLKMRCWNRKLKKELKCYCRLMEKGESSIPGMPPSRINPSPFDPLYDKLVAVISDVCMLFLFLFQGYLLKHCFFCVKNR